MPPSRRDELIDAAVKVFYRHGFHSTSLDRVLSEGGISRMTLYNHFKSKEELIVAALRRRDEVFRNRMMRFVESRASDPVDRIMAVFDFHARWFGEKGFRGCMFINASAEFCDTESVVRRFAAETKRSVVRYLREQCEAAGLRGAGVLSEQLNILLEGSIVSAQIMGQVEGNGGPPEHSAELAKAAAERLIEGARVEA